MTQENIPLQPNEKITSIQGYEGLYSITNFGRIWSHGRISKFGRNYKNYKAKFLKLNINVPGYYYVNLYKDNNIKNCMVHILVATHFIPNPDNLPEVNHKDGNKLNCRKDNLEWCTDRENKNHAMINGLFKFKRTSRFYGVSLYRNIKYRENPWRVLTYVNKRQKFLGYFKTEIEAAQAYNKYVVEHDLNRPLNKIEV